MPTKQVVKDDGVALKEDRLATRLDEIAESEELGKLTFGKDWRIWWVPEGEAGGEVNLETIDWEGINAAEIPREVVEEHPACENRSQWEQRAKQGWDTLWQGLVVFLASVILYSFRDTYTSVLEVSQAQTVETIIALGVIGGLVSIAIGIFLWGFGTFFEALRQQGVTQAASETYSELKGDISRRVPVSIEFGYESEADQGSGGEQNGQNQ